MGLKPKQIELSTAGDLIVRNGAGTTVLPVGADGQILVVDTADSTKVKWSDLEDISQVGNARPDRLFLGDLMAYPNEGKYFAGGIQYTRVYLLKDEVINQMECFTVDADPSETVKMGIYDQVTPTSTSDVPNARVAQTAARALVNGDDGTYITESLTSAYTVPATGYYWMALIISGGTTKFAISDQFRADFLPRREESGAGSTLPATASGLSNPTSACIYVAGVK